MRFSIVLIAGIITISLLDFLQFPIFPFWYIGYVPGFIVGLAMGYLVKGVGKGILGGLISFLLGSIIGGVVVGLWHGALAQYFGMGFLALLLVLVSLLPWVSCFALGMMFSKTVSQIRGFMVKHKRHTIVAVSVLGLFLIAPIAWVALIDRYSHERCDGLVWLLEDQYHYVVAEKPMNLREEVFYPFGPAKLVDCGESDEKFISELLDSGNATKVYYFKTFAAGYLWFLTSSWDRVVYVRYGLWQFKPIKSVDNSWISEFLLAYFVFPIFVFPIFNPIFVAAIAGDQNDKKRMHTSSTSASECEE